ncbi:hypothetical protein D9M68_476850 [compost metagenome]
MENIIDADHRLGHTAVIPDVADIELDLVVGQFDPHVFLLLLIAAENPDFADVGIQEAFQDRMAERTCTAGNHQNFIFKHNSPQ